MRRPPSQHPSERSHVRLLEVIRRDPLELEVAELESGDAVAVMRSDIGGTVLLTVYDVDRDPVRSALGAPTVVLSPAEARTLGRRLLLAANLLESRS
jgi:hypothetical protein